ncbi:MAG: protein kinase [Myxococcales bacterium]|nr:protein kinase [Myxococcales bacterium]
MNLPDAHNKSTPGDDETLPPMPERIAGRYNVRGLLGRGGFGAVYEAYDELEERPVALKVIRRDASLDPPGSRSSEMPSATIAPVSHASSGRALDGLRKAQVTRSFGNTQGNAVDTVMDNFKAEFRLLTQLHHPNLAAVYDFGRCDGDVVYFTQELLSGQSLAEFLRGASRETVVEIFVQLARALDYIHALGFVHEDIKPSNVIVCQPDTDGSQPQAKLIDFGLARLFRRGNTSASELDDPEEYKVLGTPGFSAPEKVKGEPTDSRSDIYSLAATIYTAVRGGRPFPSRTFKEALRNQLDWRPELAGALLQSCGPVVAELVGRMLSPDPNLRPQSARSIVLELLRRESVHIRDRQKTAQDRREFARVLVEHLPFVDRADYLDILLVRAYEVLHSENSRASQRGGHLIRTVLVEAPEGMGKARLLAEMRREVQLGDGLFVEGNCWTSDGDGLGPFAPVVLQLATALGERSPTVRQYHELIRAARERNHETAAAAQLLEFLIRCSSEHSYVLHLSDLARGSELNRTLVDQLARAIDHNEARILLCISTEPQPKLRPALDALRRDHVAELFNLRPFQPKEMLEVLRGILGEAPALKDLVTMLDKLTGGHPLSFRETLRVLIEESILVRDNDSWVLRSASIAAEQLHKTLAQRSEARLDALGVSAWEIVSILYLIEAPIDEEQLAALTDLRRERFRRTLDRLEGEGLILCSAISGKGQVALAHASVREAVRIRYDDSLNETRLDLAERIGELDGKEPSLIYLRARLLDDAAESLEAIGELEKAAEALFAAAQPQLAAHVLERIILRLRKQGRITGLPRLLKAQLNLVERAAGALNDPRREAAHLEAGILVAELLADHRAQALFWLGLVDRYTVEGNADSEVALYRLQQAAQAAKQARDRVLELRIANRRAEVLLGAGEIEQSVRCSKEAMEILEIPDADDTHACHIIGTRLRGLSLAGQLTEARRLHEVAKPIAARVSVLQRQSYLSGIAYLAVLGNEPERAIPETRQAIEQLRAVNITRMLISPLHNLGDLLLRSGDLEAAAEAFREALRLAGLHGHTYQIHLNCGFLGYTLARLGKVEEGAAMLADARRGFLQVQNEQFGQHQLRLLDAEVAHMVGQSPRARRELEEMLADFQSSSELSLAQWAQEALSRIERDRGTSFIETPEEPESTQASPDEETVRTKELR